MTQNRKNLPCSDIIYYICSRKQIRYSITSDNVLMNRLNFTILVSLCFVVAFVGCRRGSAVAVAVPSEDKQAKSLLQGVWVDNETSMVVFKMKGDTVFYPDTTSVPAFFMVVGDSLVIGSSTSKYPIVKQSANVFWFKNQNGDVVKLVKSDNPNDTLAFSGKKTLPQTVTELEKRDTVVVYEGERYHCYVTVNPTRYKVLKSAYNDDGVRVDNVYYDNIIHISVYHGARKVYSRDIVKSMFAGLVPGKILEQSVLGNITFNKVDADGFHFNASVCIPDGASCYMLDTNISFEGRLDMELVEY